ncbi:hypothetical protein SEA_MABODAMACA_47 [Microbacterium phage Mabodamaca]|uniref:Uncharacterized protein n=1 Tax=Microbacterium phage Mabodamaca TaxID=3078574 RepID=A0AA96NIM1_9CAUD|nr:hypothetical protein SEA_MABODAMACA_47 [Microbacterium phage Mabodamaca]
MAASLTRICPTCDTERVTPDDFRDPGEERRPGRPPRSCLSCRERNPELAERQRKNVAARPAARAKQREYANRPDAVIAVATAELHPDGVKRCPEVAGCGLTKPLSDYGTARHQADGLHVICDPCDDERRALRSR